VRQVHDNNFNLRLTMIINRNVGNFGKKCQSEVFSSWNNRLSN